MRQSFKDFLNLLPTAGRETIETVSALSEAHPTIKNHPTVQRILNDDLDHVSFNDLSDVLNVILQKTVKLARETPRSSPDEKALILAEQNVLGLSASVLSATMCSRLYSSIDKLSNIAHGLSIRK